MGVYTDPRLLDVRGAVEKLPLIPYPTAPGRRGGGGEGDRDRRPFREQAQFGCTSGCTNSVQPGAIRVIRGTEGLTNESQNENADVLGSACPVNEKPPLTTPVISGGQVGPAGFEPTTSCTPSKRASQAALRPEPSTPAF